MNWWEAQGLNPGIIAMVLIGALFTIGVCLLVEYTYQKSIYVRKKKQRRKK